jgi:hypothetical protein
MCIQTLFRWKPDNLIDWSIDEWRPAVVSALFARGDERKWYEQLPFSSLLCYYYSRSAAFSFSFFTTAVDGSCVLYANMCWRTIISRLLPPPPSLSVSVPFRLSFGPVLATHSGPRPYFRSIIKRRSNRFGATRSSSSYYFFSIGFFSVDPSSRIKCVKTRRCRIGRKRRLRHSKYTSENLRERERKKNK